MACAFAKIKFLGLSSNFSKKSKKFFKDAYYFLHWASVVFSNMGSKNTPSLTSKGGPPRSIGYRR